MNMRVIIMIIDSTDGASSATSQPFTFSAAVENVLDGLSVGDRADVSYMKMPDGSDASMTYLRTVVHQKKGERTFRVTTKTTGEWALSIIRLA